MIVYLANYRRIEKIYPKPVDDIWILSSYWEIRNIIPGSYIYSRRHILDSGAYTAIANPGKVKTIDWRDYAAKYADFINKTDQPHYFELDIDSIVGHDEVLILRDIIEQRTGKPSIPVWHKSRGKDEWIDLCERYDYVAIGGFVTREIRPDQYKFIAGLLGMAAKMNARVHGLGFTSTEWLRRLKFYSVDSMTWVVGARFGNLCESVNGNMRQRYSDRMGTRVKDKSALQIYNFEAWVKFQKWAEGNL